MSQPPLQISTLQDPTGRYQLNKLIGHGIFGNVYSGFDKTAGDAKVAIKIQKYTTRKMKYIQEEYRILRDHSNHPNIPDFYGIYCKKGDISEIWFVMEVTH